MPTSEIQFIDEEQQDSSPTSGTSEGRGLSGRSLGLALLALAVGVLIGLALTFTFADRGPEMSPDPLDALLTAQSVPRPLLAAELFNAEPSAAGLRDLFEVVGGFEGMQVAVAGGAFDLVRFDPLDHDRLLATHRLSYGDAENQDANEVWQVTSEGEVEQALWAAAVPHDFVHYNADGTTTVWTHAGGDGFAPRQATSLGRDGQQLATSAPVYASRFTAVGGTVFALTGNGDYYTHDRRYVDLIADDGRTRVILDNGARFGWIDTPSPDLVVAYPAAEPGSTSVWDARTLELLPQHPLAGRPYRRSAISGDESIAVGVTHEGAMEVIDLETGLVEGTFGDVDVDRIDLPITLNHDGTVAITIENTGRVTMWWVGSNQPVASILADASQPRWLSAEYAASAASAVARDGSRIALRTSATSTAPVMWLIIDSDIRSWVSAACDLAGRSLLRSEAAALGLRSDRLICAG